MTIVTFSLATCRLMPELDYRQTCAESRHIYVYADTISWRALGVLPQVTGEPSQNAEPGRCSRRATRMVVRSLMKMDSCSVVQVAGAWPARS